MWDLYRVSPEKPMMKIKNQGEKTAASGLAWAKASCSVKDKPIKVNTGKNEDIGAGNMFTEGSWAQDS